jgi:hypothetical protein
MPRKAYLKVLILLSIFAFAFQASSFLFKFTPPEAITPGTTVYSVLKSLGDKSPNHLITPTQQMVDRGRELVFEGITTGPDGKRRS